MTLHIRCDGDCGSELADRAGLGLPRVELTGHRAEFSAGAHGMPAGDFHLCADCGRRAFAAIRWQPAAPGGPHPVR